MFYCLYKNGVYVIVSEYNLLREACEGYTSV